MGRRWARIALPLYLGAIYSTLGVIRVLSNALRDAGVLRLTVGVTFAVTAVALLALLGVRGLLKTSRTWVTLIISGAAYGAALSQMDSPEEKIHFIEYGAVAVLAFFAAPERFEGVKRYVVAALFTLAAGWLDEGIQALLPSRYYDLRDVAFNALAGVFALAALAGVTWRATATTRI